MKHPNQDDSEFWEGLKRARVGAPNDRAEFLEPFREYLRNVADQAVGQEIRSKMSSSDFVQEALIQAQGDMVNCDAASKAEFKAWLRRILLNDILNSYRNLRRQKRDIRRERKVDSGLPLIDQHGKTPSSFAALSEDKELLLRAIDQLKPEFQQVVTLRHRENMTFSEISQAMNRSPDAARMLWNRAIERLAQLLREIR